MAEPGTICPPAIAFEIWDGAGRRMVCPRKTSGEAIDVICRAVAGFGTFPRDRRDAWLHLRDRMGYHVVELYIAKAPMSPKA